MIDRDDLDFEDENPNPGETSDDGLTAVKPNDPVTTQDLAVDDELAGK